MASKNACAAEGTPSLLLRTLDVVSLCVEKPLQLSLGPRAFRLPFTAKMVPSIVYQERNSRAVQGEFGAGGHGLADRVGMIPVNESHRENRMGAKRRKERDLGAGCLCRACQLLGRRFRSEISPPRSGPEKTPRKLTMYGRTLNHGSALCFFHVYARANAGHSRLLLVGRF